MQNTLYTLSIKWNYSLEYYKIENLECPNFGILSNKWKLYRSEWYTQNGIHHIFIIVYWESNFGFHGNYAIQKTSPVFRIEDWINYTAEACYVTGILSFVGVTIPCSKAAAVVSQRTVFKFDPCPYGL